MTTSGTIEPPTAEEPDDSEMAAEVPRSVTCPICATEFDPRDSAGQCPVCGEQVVPAELVTHDVPVLTPVGNWLKTGGWRLVLVVLVLAYQVGLFLWIWHAFVVNHLL
jgi:hypothetical protein